MLREWYAGLLGRAGQLLLLLAAAIAEAEAAAAAAAATDPAQVDACHWIQHEQAAYNDIAPAAMRAMLLHRASTTEQSTGAIRGLQLTSVGASKQLQQQGQGNYQ